MRTSRDASYLALAATLMACAADGISSDPDAGTADARGGTSAELEAFIHQQLEASHKPGLAAVVVRDGAVVWADAFGFADVDAQVPVENETLFEIASIAKTVTAVALLQLWEQGAFELDDDVSAHLPFEVRNPASPDTPITFRQLLTHTSSVMDNWDVMDALYVADADAIVPLADFMSGYFTPGGAYWDEHRNFHASYGPGDRYDYSNIGITLVGYLVERISGQPFADYTRDHVFAPLGMNTTTWSTPSSSATPYLWEGDRYQAEPRWGYPDWPSGHLYTSSLELGRFLAAIVRGGELGGVRILASATVDEMLRLQVPSIEPTQALVWYTKHDGTLIGHDGQDDGWTSEMFFRVSDGVGVILLLNGSGDTLADDAGVFAIEDRLFAEAASL
jgi:CubicO group peptidase (beta-lactamase class C family)